jgi:hypothetical protein
LLPSIFGPTAAAFTYNGDVKVDGRVFVEFGFRVPLERSGYSISDKQHRAIVAYDGTFLVDPKNFDLVRLTVHADQIPADLNTCEDTTTVEYSTVRLSHSEFLLPKDVRWRVVRSDGGEFENRTVFSGCHEFRAESALHFGAPSETEQTETHKTVSQALALRPGLAFTIALT